MLKHRVSGRLRSLLRAVAEVKANPHQFAREWIAPFDAVIRRGVGGSTSVHGPRERFVGLIRNRIRFGRMHPSIDVIRW